MNPNFVLIAAMMGLMLVGIDISVMNVVVEAIRGSFQIGLNGVEWVLNIYTLAYATLLLNAGALSDRFGPRFTFMAGVALFGAILGIFGAEHFTASLTPILALASVALAAGVITVSLTDFSSRV